MEAHQAKRAKIEVLDTEIQREEQALHLLRSKRNDCTPISVLHTEVLCIIFRYYVFAHEDLPLRMHGRHHSGLNSFYDIFPRSLTLDLAVYAPYAPALSAIRLTHICRHWRAIARDDATLWTHVLMTSEKWTWRMLERSKGAALKVNTHLAGDFVRRCRNHTVRATRAALQNLHRIDDLTMSITGNDDRMKPIFEQLSQPAPMLSSLRFTHITSSRTMMHRSDVPLPDAMFGGVPPPRLKRLVLQGYHIPWSSQLLKCRSLVHLEISHGGERTASTLGEMQGALSGLPCLESLSLCDIFPHSEAGARPLSLPFLKKLNLEDDLQRCITFLQHLADVPPSASICIHGVGTPGQASKTVSENTLRLYGVLAPFCKGARTLHIEGANTSIHDPFFARVYCWSSIVPMDDSHFPEVASDPKVAISIHSRTGSLGSFLCPDVVQDVLNHLVQETIESLSCNAFDRDGYHLERWVHIFARLSSVRNLRVNAQMLAIFLNSCLKRPWSIVTAPSQDSNGLPLPPAPQAPPNPLPALRHLVLSHALVTPSLHTKLCTVLTAPTRTPHLTSLRICRTAIRESHLAQIRTLIPDVDFEPSAPMGISVTFFQDDIVPDIRAEAIAASRWIQALSVAVKKEPVEIMNPFLEGEADF
ncbi:hypothetical protein OF83DRAFT_1149238 [Amylostereum chailletii]|nr:hypothetical protein OF83DRAFT_1149238 [Amylostereum chailletii]